MSKYPSELFLRSVKVGGVECSLFRVRRSRQTVNGPVWGVGYTIRRGSCGLVADASGRTVFGTREEALTLCDYFEGKV